MKKTFEESLKNLGKTLDTGVQRAAKAVNNSKQGIYRAAAYVERDLQDHGTTLGALCKTLEDVLAKAVRLQKDIEKESGCVKKTGSAVKKGLGALDQGVNNLAGSIRKYYDDCAEKIQQEFYTNGRIDDAKIEAFVQRQEQTFYEYGYKLVSKLKKAAIGTRGSIVESYRREIPSQSELANRYAGIGSEYGGILTRSDYEGCLAFHAYAERSLPSGMRYRNQILADIKATASENLTELIENYKIAELKEGFPNFGDTRKSLPCKHKLRLVSEHLDTSKSKRKKK
jgi:hypothetical protein